MSFGPFLGGKRICLGKTFAEVISKISGPNLIWHFNFEFVDKKHLNYKPWNNIAAIYEPEILVKVTSAEHNILE
jgi:cytochrome P450